MHTVLTRLTVLPSFQIKKKTNHWYRQRWMGQLVYKIHNILSYTLLQKRTYRASGGDRRTFGDANSPPNTARRDERYLATDHIESVYTECL